MDSTINKLIRRHTILAVLSVVAIIIIAGGTSYALFISSHENTDDQVIDIGNFDMTLSSSTGQIILSDLYPSNEQSTGSESTYSFTLSNTGTYKISYSIYLKDNTTQFMSISENQSTYGGYAPLTTAYYQYIDFKLDDRTAANLADSYNSASEIIPLLTGTINAGATETHNIKFWLDSSAPNEINGRMIVLNITADGSATS